MKYNFFIQVFFLFVLLNACSNPAKNTKNHKDTVTCLEDIIIQADTCVHQNGLAIQTNLVYSDISAIKKLFCCAKQIKYLSLDAQSMTDQNLKALAQFQYLETLRIKNIQKLPQVIFQLPSLTNLELSVEPGFPDVILPDTLQTLTTIKHVSLMGFDEFPNTILTLPQLQSLAISLDVSNNQNKTNYLPTSLSKVKTLESIYLGYFQAFPKVLLDLPQLKSLKIEESKITIPPQIDHIKNLEFLDLMGNDFTSIPASLGNLTQLNTLFLPALKQFPVTLGNLKALRYFKIYRNQSSPGKQLPDMLKGMINLEELTVMDADFPTFDKIAQSLKNLHHLKIFSYIGDLEAIPTEVYQLTQLEELYLRKNIYKGEQLKEVSIPKGFANLGQLKVLSLVDMNLKSLPPDISTLKNLTQLNLRGSEMENYLITKTNQ